MDTAAALNAVASAPRRHILNLLMTEDLNAGKIAAQFDMSWSAVSQHLGVLRKAGLIEVHREGKSMIYSTSPERLGPLHQVLLEMWETDIDRLAKLAESEAKSQQ
ncbi:MAG TPA: metalloregulator ArsR/SmtB family transcription factor [Acidimicrobiia bacterium]|nr:metalloregulator ArsR/SmtB family transcription factor [Acidimicrobiia bacterium]